MVDSTTPFRAQKDKKPGRAAESRLAMAEIMQTVENGGLKKKFVEHRQARAEAARKKLAGYGNLHSVL